MRLGNPNPAHAEAALRPSPTASSQSAEGPGGPAPSSLPLCHLVGGAKQTSGTQSRKFFTGGEVTTGTDVRRLRGHGLCHFPTPPPDPAGAGISGFRGQAGPGRTQRWGQAGLAPTPLQRPRPRRRPWPGSAASAAPGGSGTGMRKWWAAGPGGRARQRAWGPSQRRRERAAPAPAHLHELHVAEEAADGQRLVAVVVQEHAGVQVQLARRAGWAPCSRLGPITGRRRRRAGAVSGLGVRAGLRGSPRGRAGAGGSGQRVLPQLALVRLELFSCPPAQAGLWRTGVSVQRWASTAQPWGPPLAPHGSGGAHLACRPSGHSTGGALWGHTAGRAAPGPQPRRGTHATC